MDRLMTLLTWLEGTALARAMQQSPWLYPSAETAHILGLALLVGAAAMFDLRLLGLSPRLPVADVARHLLPWAWVGLGTALVSGFLLFAADPVGLWSNVAFRAKLLLIALAGLNAAAFHAWPFRSVATWNRFTPTPRAAKLAAALSLALWATIAALGRFIAYLE